MFRAKILLLSLIVATGALGSPVRAQSIALEYQGALGVWMPEEMAQRLLADVRRGDLLKLEVGELKLQLETRGERVFAMQEAIAHAEAAEKIAVGALESALKERDRAQAALKKWYRHPALWVTVGVVATVVLQVIAVKSYQAYAN